MPAMVELICGFCHTPFLKMRKHFDYYSKKGQTVFYCGLKCGKSKDKIFENCHTCGEPIARQRSWKRSKSGFYYCTRKCATISNNTIYKSKENHPNWVDGKGSYRHGRELKKCIGCPETRYFLLTVHHKDGDRTNNSPENLEDVCIVCHVLRHLAIKDGRIVIRWDQLTSPETKEFLHKEEHIEIDQTHSRPKMG